jgi:hypothetical protein
MSRFLPACAALLGLGLGPGPEPSNPIDRHVEAALKAAGVDPAPLCDDATFLRRAWLDLAGTVPPVDRVRRFLADRDPDKRAKVVDELLASEGYARRWAHLWLRTLTGRRGVPDEEHDGRRLLEHLQRALGRNDPYDRLVRELVSASGLADENGAVNFALRYRANPVDLAGAVGRTFLGVRIQCAQCHDHPFADWNQDQFWGLAGFFARTWRFFVDEPGFELTGVVEAGRDRGIRVPGQPADPKPAEGDKEEDEQARTRREYRKVPAVYLDGRAAGADEASLRAALADALVDPKRSPTFAANAVNRVWAAMFGRGLLEPLDGFTLRGTPAPPPLLNELADAFVARRYDLAALIRTIATSKAYQRASRGPGDPATWSRMAVRPLDEDQLFDAVSDVGGLTHEPSEEEAREMSPEEAEEEQAYRDLLPREAFGDQNLSQTRALALLNGEIVHEAVEAGARACLAVNGRNVGRAHVEWLILATLSRAPTEEEVREALELIGGARTRRRDGLEDVLWALLNSSEFVSNH